MSVWELFEKKLDKEGNKPTLEEVYGYEEEQKKKENENFLDKLVEDIKQKQTMADSRARSFTR